MTGQTEASGKDAQQAALDKVAIAYDVNSVWYAVRGFFVLLLAHRNTVWSQVFFFAPNYGPKDLELACGDGTLLSFILRWRRWKKLPTVDIIGLDYSDRMLEGARHRFAGAEKMQFMQGDAANLPFPDSTFDTVNIINAVHSIPPVDEALRSALRVLKPGGTLYANVVLEPRGNSLSRAIAARINAWGVRTGQLVKAYDRGDIESRFLAAGFEITASEIDGNCVNLKTRKPKA